jgi:hypothetical protein
MDDDAVLTVYFRRENGRWVLDSAGMERGNVGGYNAEPDDLRGAAEALRDATEGQPLDAP